MLRNTYLGLSPAGFHRIAYVQWGNPTAEHQVICVHGLTRNGRDFDFLAQGLADRATVVCPDIVGRGQSDWLPEAGLYGYPQYCADMTALIARMGTKTLDWVGTSMGGLIGMMLAAQPQTPIRKLILNDIGPLIPKKGLERIAAYAGIDPVFSDLAAAETCVSQRCSGFGTLTPDQWTHLTRHGVRTRADGMLGLAYDPGISQAFTSSAVADIDLWNIWDRVQCPTLVIRGAHSDLLDEETAQAMTKRGPKARLIQIPDAGHAPALMSPDQIAIVRDFLFEN